MTTEKVNDLDVISLSDYLSPKTFRLISAEDLWIKGGISEVPVELNVHLDFSKKINFDIKRLQKLFGFSIMGPKLVELNGGPYYSGIYDGKLKLIELNDCGELWIIKFEYFDGTSKLYAFKGEEAVNLLNFCRKPMFLE